MSEHANPHSYAQGSQQPPLLEGVVIPAKEIRTIKIGSFWMHTRRMELSMTIENLRLLLQLASVLSILPKRNGVGLVEEITITNHTINKVPLGAILLLEP